MEYTMKEIKAAAKAIGATVTKRAATLNGAATYKVNGNSTFNSAVTYTKSDLIDKLFN